VTYPHETLHEIITNAVLHRDYSIPVDVHVRIYDDRIEVESPGRLPGHVTKQNILDEQSARNPKIVPYGESATEAQTRLEPIVLVDSTAFEASTSEVKGTYGSAIAGNSHESFMSKNMYPVRSPLSSEK